MDHHDHGGVLLHDLILLLPFAAAAITYCALALTTSRRYPPFPVYRSMCWTLGVVCAAAAVVGPLAERVHHNFTAHMLVHLLLGMLAPLLLTLAAPMTLLLRSLGTRQARRLVRILKSRPLRVVTDPIVASVLNIGGLWVLYTTDLYPAMQHSVLLHTLVHLHVFMAGYVFTSSMIYIDPTPHRKSYLYRTIVLWGALTGHNIIAKQLYTHPPLGVPAAQAELGSRIMYYGGDVVDAVIIFVLFLHWFRSARPRTIVSPA